MTPRRLPIEGEPCECKQEAANGIVMAGCTNRMVKMANPPEIADVDLEKAALGRKPVERACRVDKGNETDVDVDRTPTPGGEPATRDCGVDEGDGTERRDLQLQQTGLYCEESCQRNENAIENIPNTNGLPLKGEWTAYPSGETTDSKEAKLEGCEGGMDEPIELLTMSVEPYVEDCGDIPHMYLGGMRMRMDNANGPGCRTDESTGQTDMSNMSNNAGMAGMSDGEGAGTYLDARGVKRVVDMRDGIGSQSDVSSGHWDVPSIEMDVMTPVNVTETVSIPRKHAKPPDSPIGTTRRAPDELNSCGRHADASSGCTDAHSIETDRQMAANDMRNVRKR